MPASPQPVVLLVGRFGDGGLDPTFPQVGADRAAGVGLVAQHPAGSGPGPAGSAAADPDPGHHRPQPEAVVTLPGTGDPGDRPASPVSGQVNLARQPAPGPADGFPARPARRPPDFPPSASGSSADFLSFDPPPCVQLGRRDDLRGDVGGRRRGGHQRRADGRGPPRRPRRSSSPDLRPRRRRGATPRGPRPGCRRLTSGDAG